MFNGDQEAGSGYVTTFDEFAVLRLSQAEDWVRVNPQSNPYARVLAGEVLVDLLLHTGSRESRDRIVEEIAADARAGDVRAAARSLLIAQSQAAEQGAREFLVETLHAVDLDVVEGATVDLAAILFFATAFDAYRSYRYTLPELLWEQARLGNSIAMHAAEVLETAFRRAQMMSRGANSEFTAGEFGSAGAAADPPAYERKQMRKLSQWATDLLLRPQLEVLAETFVMDPEDAANQMFRIQLLYAYVGAVDPNGRIANDPSKTEDPLIKLMLRLANPSVYSSPEDELHWVALWSVLRDETAEHFTQWISSHRSDFWWREKNMPAVVAWGYEDEDGDYVQRFPHMQDALNGVVEALSKQASTTRAQSSGSQNSSNSQGGCYIATAVYGSYDAPEVVTLRTFRDQTLALTKSGRALIRTYYAVSPSLAKHFAFGSVGHRVARSILTRLVAKLSLKQPSSPASAP